MTDTISKLADDILALINAQPRTPTKDELHKIIETWLFTQVVGELPAAGADDPDLKQIASDMMMALDADKHARALSKQMQLDFEKFMADVMNRPSPDTEDDAKHGGFTAMPGWVWTYNTEAWEMERKPHPESLLLWQDNAQAQLCPPHPEATQAAKETYTLHTFTPSSLDLNEQTLTEAYSQIHSVECRYYGGEHVWTSETVACNANMIRTQLRCACGSAKAEES